MERQQWFDSMVFVLRVVQRELVKAVPGSVVARSVCNYLLKADVHETAGGVQSRRQWPAGAAPRSWASDGEEGTLLG